MLTSMPQPNESRTFVNPALEEWINSHTVIATTLQGRGKGKICG